MKSTGPGRTRPSWDGTETPGPSDRQRPGLLALVVRSTDDPTCTIYPPDVAAPYRSTTWISASGDDFVSLERCR